MRAASSGLLILLLAATSFADDALFRPAQETFGRLSPDGSRIVSVVNDEGRQSLATIDLETQVRTPFFSTTLLGESNAAISGLSWIDNDTILAVVVQLTDGIAQLSDTRNKTNLLVIDLDADGAIVRYIASSGMVLGNIPGEEDTLLFARPGSTSVVYRMDTSKLHVWGQTLGKTARIDGGQLSRNHRVTELEGFVLSWMRTADGFVNAAFRWLDDEGFALVIRDRDSGQWTVEKEWSADNIRDWGEGDTPPKPEAMLDGTRDFIVFDNNESGRRAVYRYNFASSEKTLVYSHPTAEIVDIGLDRRHTGVQYVSYFEDGVVKYDYLNDTYREIADDLAQRYPQYSALIAATDDDERRYLVFMRSPQQPGRMFVMDRSSGEMKPVLEVMPWVDETAMADSVAGRVDSHGLEIEYLLTLPESAQPLPLVVYPHGGPSGVMVSRHFNPVVQYLAGRGMAVLQVNHRGSAGYGTGFVEEGKGEFGELMLDDIEAAIDAVVADPAIDGSRLCVIGESYGGYASLMLPIRNPGRFRCAASYAGVTDLGLLLASHEGVIEDYWREQMLADEVPEERHYEVLRELSPLYNAERLDVPVLLAHGEDDLRVDIEQSYRMAARLRQLGRDLTWKAMPGQRHAFKDWQAAYDYYSGLGDFLESRLMGQ